MQSEQDESTIAPVSSRLFRALAMRPNPLVLLIFIAAIISCSGCTHREADDDMGDKKTAPASKTNSSEKQDSTDLFVDATEQSGMEFVHFNGLSGEYWLPEITGSGCALLDYDNDGDLDVYLVQGAELRTADKANSNPDEPHSDRLLRNDLTAEGPRFTDVTLQSGISATGYGMGVATGDYNNDGWVDLYVTNLRSNQLWKNNGNGTFTDETAAANADDSRWSASAAFIDYDRDGFLDLFVTNYVDFTPDRECFSKTSARDFCGPQAYDPVPDRLLHNLGNGSFEDVSVQSGIVKTFGPGLGVVVADFNEDGWSDVYVANDGRDNQMWINQAGNGTFHDESHKAGVAVNRMGVPEAGMGVDADDFDGDGDLDLIMMHLEKESNTLYANLGNGYFEDQTIRVGLHAPSLQFTSFGGGFFDYDNDGWLDVLVLNGAVRVVESLKPHPYPLHQPNQLFRNDGNASFQETTQQAGPAFKVSEVSRGAAFGDIDNDGDTDVVILNNRGRARLLLNQVGNRQHWIGLRIMEKDGLRDALQSRVEIVTDQQHSVRRVRTDGSYCSARDPRVLIGLGTSDQPATIRVHWTDGDSDEFRDLAIDRYWEIRRDLSPR